MLKFNKDETLFFGYGETKWDLHKHYLENNEP